MILIKPSGQEVFVNDKSLEHALLLGWVPKESVQAQPDDETQLKRRGRPPKVKDADDSAASS